MLVSKHGEVQSGSPADQWLGWVHRHADRLGLNGRTAQRIGQLREDLEQHFPVTPPLESASLSGCNGSGGLLVRSEY